MSQEGTLAYHPQADLQSAATPGMEAIYRKIAGRVLPFLTLLFVGAWLGGRQRLLRHRRQQTTRPSPNTVHFTTRIAAATSIRVVGCGVRGRRG